MNQRFLTLFTFLPSKIIISVICFFLFFKSFPQSSYIPLENTLISNFEHVAGSKQYGFHSSIKPYLSSDLQHWVNVDSIVHSKGLIDKIIRLNSEKDTIQNPSPSSYKYIEATPLFFLHSGYGISDSLQKNISGTGIGALLNAGFGKKLFVNGAFLSANSAFPIFISRYIDSTDIIPGEGYSYPTRIGNHYKNLSGYISYSPSGIFNFQLGQGKNFIGNGYRSLLLSDVANNYSYAKITTTIWKIKYINLFANFKDIRVPLKDYWHFRDKYGTFHYLSWNLAKWLNLGLFESVIWQGKDTLSERGFDVNYLNPVIFFRPVEYSLGSADNSLMGLNLNIRLTDKISVYGQLVLDEFLLKEIRANSGWWANKYGGQFGLKYYDAFGLKGFSLQAELNEVRPYTYSHGSTLQNYAHFNQPLAHPLGANFSEVVGIMRFSKKNISAEFKSAISRFGADSAGKNFGGDIYKPYTSIVQVYGNKTGQGNAQYLMVNELNASYLLIAGMNLKIEAGIMERIKYIGDRGSSDLYLWIGLRTGLNNIYRDYM